MKEPLHLPKGSVRAILALLIVTATLAGLIFGDLKADIITALMTLSGTVVGYYFGNRSNGKKKENTE